MGLPKKSGFAISAEDALLRSVPCPCCVVVRRRVAAFVAVLTCVYLLTNTYLFL